VPSRAVRLPACVEQSGCVAQELLSEEKDLAVKNHVGSIMDWCHEGFPLVDPQGQETKDVHGAGAAWVKYFPHDTGLNFVLK